ncbi:MAG: response regulator [Candidatus Dormiibacterota bacterium]
MARVVVVDDSDTDRRLAETLLKHAGHTAVVCDDGQAGLDLIMKERPDLIITDLITPSIDGYALSRAVRSNRKTAAIPIIMVTAHYLETEVRRLAAGMGIQHVLIKPYEPQTFLDVVASALADKPAADHLGKVGLGEKFQTEHLRLVTAKLHEKVAQLEAVSHELNRTATEYKLLFNAHPEPNWVFELETLRFLEVNDAAVRRYGYSREEFLAMRITDLHAPEDVPALQQVLASSGAHPDLAVPWKHLAKDGTVIDVDITSDDLVFDGRLARCVMAQDMTQRRKVQLQIQQTQRLESLGQLAGGVAHDFNNLLGVILNFSWFVKANLTAEVESGNGEKWRPALRDMERIERAAENAARLTHQLLAFARVEVVQPRSMNIDSVVEEMAPMLRRTLGEHIELVASSVADLWPVTIDSGQLSQVITNLSVNSRDAMSKGGTLTIDAANVDVDPAYIAERPGLTPGRYVRLQVTDTGVGMDKETLERAFEPFFTTKPRGQGTGLGLATVYGIVTQAGGHVDVYSEPGLGTRVSILLPADERGKGAAEVAPRTPAARGTETVLVVEDSDDFREIVDRILSQNGYEVLVAANGPDALEMARQYAGHIDLLLTDMIMPRMLGTELAPRLVESRPDLRVLYMSGFAEPGLRPGAVAPEVALLDKPFTEPTLLARVRQSLEAES